MRRSRVGLLVVLVLAVLALTASTAIYRALHLSSSQALRSMQQAVEAQNREAAERLRRLTAERDALQLALHQSAAEQARVDNDAQTTIDRLTSELQRRPVRVRLDPAACGAGGASTGSGAAADSGHRAGDAAEAVGLLPEKNRQRLAESLREIEVINAAYASCRSTLLAYWAAQQQGQ